MSPPPASGGVVVVECLVRLLQRHLVFAQRLLLENQFIGALRYVNLCGENAACVRNYELSANVHTNNMQIGLLCPESLPDDHFSDVT